jgi:hypothetical protein
MECKSKYKVPGGKLIEIRLVHENGTVVSLKIIGDFFLLPEEKLGLIEKSVEGMKINADEIDIASKIAEVASDGKIEMIGIDPASIAKAVKMAVGA